MEMINWDTINSYFAYDPARPMIFSSLVFFVLFLVFYAVYIAGRNAVLWRTFYTLAFSLFFYYKSSGIYLLLLIFSTIFDFILGHYIYRAPKGWKRRLLLWFSLGANLGMLLYFKYTNFIFSSIYTVQGKTWEPLDIFLPAGISFFVFQTMSYSIDVYRGKLIPLTEQVKDFRSFMVQLMDFGFFVTYFPQLVAGPIVRAADFLPQINQRVSLNRETMGRGLLLICGGLFKKAIISDYISINYVDRIFENPTLYSGLENLVGVYGYAVQIYCDFSGYSDMAIGLALIMGFHLPDNFRTPYQSSSVQEFWRRWHMSLSTWLRDYLYISLGGNRHGKLRTYINLMLTMVLGGLWHGASWVYIVWGALHGAALAFDRWLSEWGRWFKLDSLRSVLFLLLLHSGAALILSYLQQRNILEPEYARQLMMGNMTVASLWLLIFFIALFADFLIKKIYKPWTFGVSHKASVIFVFHFVIYCWIFFRAGAINNPMPPLQTTGEVLGQIFSAFHAELWPQLLDGYPAVLGLIALALVLHAMPARWDIVVEKLFVKAPALVKALTLAFIVWLVIQTTSADIVPFIYFQF